MSTAAPSAAPAPAQTNGSSGPQTPATPSQQPSQPQASGNGRDERGRFVGGQKDEGQPAEPAKAAKLRIKDMELDEEAAYREIQRGRQSSKLLTEAQKRAEAAEAKERALEEKSARYKANIGEWFKDQGLSPEDAKRLASEYIYRNHIEPEELSPEQQRIRQLESELKERTDKETAQKTAAEKAEAERIAAEEAKALETELMEAMDGSLFPKDRDFIAYTAREMAKFAERGVTISAEQGARLAEEKLGKLGGRVVSEADVERLQSWMGKEAFQKHVLKVLEWANGKLGKGAQPSQPKGSPAPTSATRKRMTPQQWDEMQRKAGLK